MEKIIEALKTVKEELFTGWANLKWDSLLFARKDETLVVLIALVCSLILALMLRIFRKNTPGRTGVIIPSIIGSFRKSHLSFIRHAPVFLFFLGLPFFFIALADPYISFTKEETTFLGKRIAILLDASGSMSEHFFVTKLKQKDQQRFFTTVAAAEYFMKMRIKGKYHDLMSLIEFGDEAYIITPFTNDYENILTSVSLIGEPEEWQRFPDKGTKIAQAIGQSIELFRAFGFLKAAGNAIVIFSDGEDQEYFFQGKSFDEILKEAKENDIPIYFIRTVYGADFTSNDELWRGAVEKTGGKFYSARNEKIILAALDEIDKASKGKISGFRYTFREPRFTFFALAAFVIWSLALIVFMFFKFSRKFP